MLAALNWHSCMFMLCAAVACAFAVAVLLANNVVRMAAYLIVCLSSTAGLFMLAGAEFVGAMQIMIYVGGTLVLLVFGVMLTAQASFVSLKTSAGEWSVAAIVGGSLLFLLVASTVSVRDWRLPSVDASQVSMAQVESSTQLGLGLLGVRVPTPVRGDQDATSSTWASAGVESGYLLPFEIVSVHLLVVLIGAAYLARARGRITDG